MNDYLNGCISISCGIVIQPADTCVIARCSEEIVLIDSVNEIRHCGETGKRIQMQALRENYPIRFM